MMHGPCAPHHHTCSLCGTAAPCRCLGVEDNVFVCERCDIQYVDVFGCRLAVGRRLIFAAQSMASIAELRVGTIVTLTPSIRVRVDDSEFTIVSPRHLAVFRTTSEAESWLRRRLEELKT
jgi:hypothetical protein